MKYLLIVLFLTACGEPPNIPTQSLSEAPCINAMPASEPLIIGELECYLKIPPIGIDSPKINELMCCIDIDGNEIDLTEE